QVLLLAAGPARPQRLDHEVGFAGIARARRRCRPGQQPGVLYTRVRLTAVRPLLRRRDPLRLRPGLSWSHLPSGLVVPCRRGLWLRRAHAGPRGGTTMV